MIINVFEFSLQTFIIYYSELSEVNLKINF